jgi:hypothetical protein
MSECAVPAEAIDQKVILNILQNVKQQINRIMLAPREPIVGLDFLIVVVPRSHSDTRHSEGLH